MSNNSPSKIRREGREAYNPFTDPMDIQPYREGTWGYMYSLPLWLEGWKEAEVTHKQRQKEEEDESTRLQDLANDIVDALENNPLAVDRLKEILDL